MNMRPPLPMQISRGQCFNESRIPEPYSSPLPVLPEPIEEFPNSPGPFSASTSREMMANSLQIQTNPMVSYNGQSNDDSPFLSGYPTNLHFSSFPFGEMSSQNPSFISQPLGTEPHFPPNHNACLDVLSAGYINYQKEDEDNSWSNSRLHGLLNFPGCMPLTSGQVGISVDVVSNENDSKEVDWKELAEDICPGSLQSNWNEFLPDPNAGNQSPEVPRSSSDVIMHEPQSQRQLCLPSRELQAAANPSTSAQSSSDVIVYQPQIQQQLSLPSRQELAMANPSTSAQSTKSRMRWTPELHESFLDAINKLGGGERATPKAILTRMNVESLSIQHVKSHLQKYRSARVGPESLEGISGERPIAAEQVSSVDLRTSVTLTEALRIQMEVQKQLHEQLEIQRKLQLKIEEQGRYLLQMLENQNKVEQEKQKPLLNNNNNGSTNPNNSQASGLDQPQEGGATTSSQAPTETSRGSQGKQKASKGRSSGEVDFEAGGSSPPLTKRAKPDDWFH